MKFYSIFFLIALIANNLNAQCTIPNHVVRFSGATNRVENSLTISDLGNSKYSFNGIIADYYQGMNMNVEVKFDKEFMFAGTKIYEYSGSGYFLGNSLRFVVESNIKLSELAKCKGFENSRINDNSYFDYEVKFYYWDSRISEPLQKQHIEIYPVNYKEENKPSNTLEVNKPIDYTNDNTEDEDDFINKEFETFYKNKKPKFKKEVEINDEKYLISFYNSDSDEDYLPTVIRVYKNFSNTWKLQYQNMFGWSENPNYLKSRELEVYQIDDAKFIYFESISPDYDFEFQNYDYCLYDVNNNEIYNLTYFSKGSNSKGQLTNGEFVYDHLNANPKILRILKYKASISDVIYRPNNQKAKENESFLDQYKEKPKVKTVPIYPKCNENSDNNSLIKCLNQEVYSLLSKQLNKNIDELDFDVKHYSQIEFSIDENGYLTNIDVTGKDGEFNTACKMSMENVADKINSKSKKVIPAVDENGNNIEMKFAFPVRFTNSDY